MGAIMRNKFLSGFLSGLAGALIIFTIALTIFVVRPAGKDDNAGSNRINNAGLNRINNAEAATKTEDEEYQKKVLQKIKKIETLIDHYYLEDVNEEAIADGIYKGILQSLGDPYSTYYTKAEYKSLMESSSGIYCGIGATVTKDVATGIISIVTPFVTGPAYEVGILPGDIIYKVEGKEVTGLDLTEVVSRIKGEEGTKVKVTIVREGESEPLEFSIPRRIVEVPTITYEMLDGKIGYIAVSEFDEVTAQQFRDAITELDKQGQKGLIVDIRNNPGGLLNTVSDMLDRMLPKGLIVYTKDKYGNREEKKSDGKEEFNKPLVVLINGNSASASEIFAGAIQDYGKGTIVGTTSFGKGIVQSIIPLQDGTAIKVTVSKYFTPKGQDIHGVGIKPDVTVELKDELKRKVIIKKEDDNQLQKAIEIIKEKIK